MKTGLKYAIILLLFAMGKANAQSSKKTVDNVTVLGNCEMCKARIEKAGKKKGETSVQWNEKSKAANITYDPSKQTIDDILKRIAQAGYDNEKYLAPDEAYAKLPECCKYVRTLKKGTGDNRESVTASNIKTEKQGEKKAPLEAIFDQYFSLKDAFIQSDVKDISKRSAELIKQVSGLDMASLSEEQHKVWMNQKQHIIDISTKISQSGKMDEQRENFSALSSDFYQLAKVAKLNYEVYFQHCPMFNNGADWLSKDSQIKNPYYGNQMLTCGKTTETIK